MKKAMLIAGGGFGVALASALLAPSLLDVNSYKDELFAALEKSTGIKMRSGGAIRLTLLPEAELFLSDVEASKDGKRLVKAEQARVSMRLLPLLHGKAEADSVALIRPTLYLRQNAASKAKGQQETPEEAPVAGAQPLPLSRVAIHEFRIEDGRVYISGGDGKRIRLKGVNLLAALDPEDADNPVSLHVDKIFYDGARYRDVTLQGAYELRPTEFTARKLTVGAAGQNVNLEILADWSSGEVKAAVQATAAFVDVNEILKGSTRAGKHTHADQGVSTVTAALAETTVSARETEEDISAPDEEEFFAEAAADAKASADTRPAPAASSEGSPLFVQGADVTAGAKIERLILPGGVEIAEGAFRAEANAKLLRIRAEHGTVQGGALTAEFSAVPSPEKGGALLKGEASVKGFSLEALPPAKAAGVSGNLSADLLFRSSGANPEAWLKGAVASGTVSSDEIKAGVVALEGPLVELAYADGKAEARVKHGSVFKAPLSGYAVSEIKDGKRRLRADVAAKGLDLAALPPAWTALARGLAGAVDVGVSAVSADISAGAPEAFVTLKSQGLSFAADDVPHALDLALSRKGEGYQLKINSFGLGGGDVSGTAEGEMTSDRVTARADLTGAGIDLSKLPVAWTGGAETPRGPSVVTMNLTADAKTLLGLKEALTAEVTAEAPKLVYRGAEFSPVELKVRAKGLKRVEAELVNAGAFGGSVQGRAEAVPEGDAWRVKGSVRAKGVRPELAPAALVGGAELPSGAVDLIADFSAPVGGASTRPTRPEVRADISSAALRYKGMEFSPVDLKLTGSSASGEMKAELRRLGALGGSLTGEASLAAPLAEGAEYEIGGKLRGEGLDLSRLPESAGGKELPRGAADLTLNFSSRAKGPGDKEGALRALRAEFALSAPEMTTADGSAKAGPIKLEAVYRDNVADVNVKRAAFAGGDVSGKAKLTFASAGLSAEGAAQLNKVELSRLPAALLGGKQNASGELTGQVTFSGQGKDSDGLVAALVSHAELSSPSLSVDGVSFSPLKLKTDGKGKAVKAVFDGTGFAGGALTGELQAAPLTTGGYAVNAVAALKNFLLEQLPERFFGGKPSPVSGKASAEVNLRTSGAGTDAMLSGLEGSISFNAGAGAIRSGTFVQAVTAARRALSGGGSSPEDEQVIVFRSAGADVKADRGVLRTENFNVNARVAAINGAGSVDLPAQTVDLRFSVKPAVSDNAGTLAAMAPVTVRGPVASPQVRLDLQAGLQQFLADPEKALQAGKGLEDEIRSLTKGGKGDLKALRENLKGEGGAALLQGLLGAAGVPVPESAQGTAEQGKALHDSSPDAGNGGAESEAGKDGSGTQGFRKTREVQTEDIPAPEPASVATETKAKPEAEALKEEAAPKSSEDLATDEAEKKLKAREKKKAKPEAETLNKEAAPKSSEDPAADEAAKKLKAREKKKAKPEAEALNEEAAPKSSEDPAADEAAKELKPREKKKAKPEAEALNEEAAPKSSENPAADEAAKELKPREKKKAKPEAEASEDLSLKKKRKTVPEAADPAADALQKVSPEREKAP